MLRKRTDAEFMTDENEPDEREELLYELKEELDDLYADIESLYEEIDDIKNLIEEKESRKECLDLQIYELELVLYE